MWEGPGHGETKRFRPHPKRAESGSALELPAASHPQKLLGQRGMGFHLIDAERVAKDQSPKAPFLSVLRPCHRIRSHEARTR